MESAVFPGAHLCDQIRTNEFFGNQELVYMGFKQLPENIFGKQRSKDKGSVSMKSSLLPFPLGHQVHIPTVRPGTRLNYAQRHKE